MENKEKLYEGRKSRYKTSLFEAPAFYGELTLLPPPPALSFTGCFSQPLERNPGSFSNVTMAVFSRYFKAEMLLAGSPVILLTLPHQPII